MNRGRPRTTIGTYGQVHVTDLGGRYRALTRFRDLDGRLRRVTATATSRRAAEVLLKERLLVRAGYGTGGVLSAARPFGDLADLWLADLALPGPLHHHRDPAAGGPREEPLQVGVQGALDRVHRVGAADPHLGPAAQEVRDLLERGPGERGPRLLRAQQEHQSVAGVPGHREGAPTARGLQRLARCHRSPYRLLHPSGHDSGIREELAAVELSCPRWFPHPAPGNLGERHT